MSKKLTESRVLEPISGEYLNIKSSRGKQVQSLNQLCEKCPKTEIYNVNTGKCVSKTGPYAKIFEKEIDYCNRYDKAIRQSVSIDKQIINDILNIKIPKQLVKDKKSLILRDIFEKNLEDPHKYNLASKLNIKNVLYQKYTHYIIILVFTLYQIIAKNPSASSFVINSVKSILGTHDEGSSSNLYLQVFTNYIGSNFLIKAISSFSFPKFFSFIVNLVSVISHLPGKIRNVYTTEHVATQGLTGDKFFNFENFNFKKKNDASKIIKVTIDEKSLSTLKTSKLEHIYNKNTSELNIDELGINVLEFKNIVKPIIQFERNFDAQSDFHTQIKFQHKTFPIYTKSKINNMIPKLKTKIRTLIKDVTSLIDEANAILELNTIKYDLPDLQTDLKDLQEKISKTKQVLKRAQLLKKQNELVKQIKKYENIIEKHSVINDFSEKDLQILNNNKINLDQKLSQLKNDNKIFNILSTSNFNAYHPQIKNHIDHIENFLNVYETLPTIKIIDTQSTIQPIHHIAKKSSPQQINNNFESLNNILFSDDKHTKISKTPIDYTKDIDIHVSDIKHSGIPTVKSKDHPEQYYYPIEKPTLSLKPVVPKKIPVKQEIENINDRLTDLKRFKSDDLEKLSDLTFKLTDPNLPSYKRKLFTNMIENVNRNLESSEKTIKNLEEKLEKLKADYN